MKKQSQFVFVILALLMIGKLSAQELLPGYQFNEEGIVQVSQEQFLKFSIIEYAVFDNERVVALDNGSRTEYKTNQIVGFTLTKSGKKFLASGNVFVEDLTIENKKMKVVRQFAAKKPLVQKDGEVMGSWFNYIMVVESKPKTIMLYKKIAEVVKPSCPELSNKIIAKEKGYFLGLMDKTDEGEIEVFKKIASEFEACNK